MQTDQYPVAAKRPEGPTVTVPDLVAPLKKTCYSSPLASHLLKLAADGASVRARSDRRHDRTSKPPGRSSGNKGLRTVKPVTIYGIPNCDTMKKARAWLEDHGIAYTFHDYKSAGIDRERLDTWSKRVGWEALLNRAGTTFRKLPDSDKQGLDEKKAIALMLAQPSLIKRPVLDLGGGKLLVGFKPEAYAEALSP
jgi:arsenate reductase (glutaredoxin)